MDSNNILLIEDDNALALGVKFSLESEKFKVFIAKSLKEADKYLAHEQINLILLDLMLPDGNGYEYLQKLNCSNKKIPVIFLSAVSDEVNIVQGLENGAEDYITKPFGVKELISRIRVILRRYSKYDNCTSTISSADVQINLNNNEVLVSGQKIELTPSEYKLLVKLMQNKNNVLTRDILIENLWDVDSNFVDDNTLSVYIKRLRDKIEIDKSKPAKIITIRGIGYSFVED